MRVLAVDFGTSNTVAGLGLDGRPPRLVTIDGSPLMPSAVFLAEDGTFLVGRDADRRARIDPSRYEPNPKRRIDDDTLLLGTSVVPVTSVIAGVLRRVGGEVRRQLGGAPDQVRLTHPARWGQHRRQILVAAARQAGLSEDPVLVPEPVAAATHFASLSGGGLADERALAVYDLGGGTFDIAVVRRRGGGYEVLAEAGLADLGGLDFDHAVLEHIGASYAEQVDALAWRGLRTPVDAAGRRVAGALAADVRDGKEALSRHPQVDIALPPPFADLHLTRVEFEELIRPNLSRSIDLMRRTIAEAGLTPDRLAGVYLVGGSSRVPLVARLIQQGLGVTPTTLDQPETSVVTGALQLAGVAAPGPVAPGTGVPVRVAGPPPGRRPAVRLPAPRLPTSPRPPRPPSTPDRRGRRCAVLLAGAVTAVLVAVPVGVFVAGNGPGGAAHTATPTDTGYDGYFDDVQIRDYLRPVYGDIRSCNDRGLTEATAGVATCTFDNGVRVTVGQAGDTLLTLDQLRRLISSTVEASDGLTAEPGEWRGGALDTFHPTSSKPGAALYWDRAQDGVWGYAVSDTLEPDGLASWWHDHFER